MLTLLLFQPLDIAPVRLGVEGRELSYPEVLMEWFLDEEEQKVESSLLPKNSIEARDPPKPNTGIGCALGGALEHDHRDRNTDTG